MAKNNFPDQKTIEQVRRKYPENSRVELVKMADPFSRLVPGDRGTVRFVDDTGTIHVSWDNGEGLGVIYGVDKVRKV